MAPPFPDPESLPPGLAAASAEEITTALSYVLRFDERGKPRRAGSEMMAGLAAERLVEHLQRAGFVILRQRPARPHSAG